MNKRKIIISIVMTTLILLLAILAYNNLSSQKKSTISDVTPSEDLVSVSTNRYEITTTQSKIKVDGRVRAYEQIDIASEVSGRLQVTAKKWKDGMYFKEGELLFQVDSEDQRFDLFAQRSSLLNAITQIMPDLKFDYPSAFQKWKSYLDDFNVERNTPQLPKISSDQEKYYVAGKNIYNLFYSIKSAEEKLKDYQIYAPFSGVFLNVSGYPGTVVSPGSPLGRLMNTSKYELSTPISSKDYKLIKRGQKVTLVSDDLGFTYNGTISRISNQIDQVTQSIPIFISVFGKELRDGMYLHGELIGESLESISALPLSAIADESNVYFLQDSIVRSKPVEIILRSDDEVYVRGINSGDDIITEGLNGLSPGQRAIKGN